jgi:hypothetical protein
MMLRSDHPFLFVTPAKAGVQGQLLGPFDPWIPAFAGMTR